MVRGLSSGDRDYGFKPDNGEMFVSVGFFLLLPLAIILVTWETKIEESQQRKIPAVPSVRPTWMYEQCEGIGGGKKFFIILDKRTIRDI